MKKLALGLLGLVVVLVAAVLIVPSFIDWNDYKPRIVGEIAEATGRDLAIDGDIGLSLLPAPALSAEKVRLANIEGGSAPTMVELEELRVRIAPMPLLRGRVQVASVVLVQPVILLEALPDGRKNWEFADAGQEGPAQAGGDAGDAQEPERGGGPRVRLDSLKIEDGTVIYRDAASGTEERVESLNATIAADSLNGPFAVNGEATVRGVQTAFDLGLGELPQDGATPLNATLRLPGAANAAGQFTGVLSVHPDQTGVRGRLKASGDDLAALIGVVAEGTETPALLAQPFTVQGEVSADPKLVSTEGLTVRLGTVSVEGTVKAKPGPPLDVNVTLATSRLDLDKLLEEQSAAPAEAARPATAAAGGSAGGATSSEAAAPPETGDFALPEDATGSLRLAVDALVYRGQVVRQVLLEATLADGRIKLGQAIALLPGGSDISLTGVLAPEQVEGRAVPRFDGRLEAASDNLRAVLDWLGVDVSRVPAERLRRTSLTGRVEGGLERVTLSDMDLRVDLSRATGGIAAALRERPALGIGLAVDKLDLDAYLPEPDAQAEAAPATASEQADTAPADGTAAPGAGAGAQVAAGPGNVLDAFDANLDLRVGSLTLRGVTARDLHVDATLQQGDVALREAVIADVAGSSARLSGTFTDLGSRPHLDAAVELKVPEPARLAKLADIDPDLATRLGAFELSGTLQGRPDELAFDASLAAQDGRFAAAGMARPLAAPVAFDAQVKVEHPNLAQLARAAAPDLALDPDLGGVNLTAQLTGTAQAFQLSDLDGRLGPVELSGSLGADLSGERPMLNVDLATGELPIAALAGATGAGQSGAPEAAPSPSGGAPDQAPSAGRWSEEPIDVSALRQLDAEVKLRSQALVLDQIRLDEATVEASLSDGVLDLRRLDGTLYDGAFSANGKIDARETVQANLALNATEVNLGRLLEGKTDRVSGPVSLDASLTTQGRSEAELVSALSGNGQLDGTLTAATKTEEQLGAALLGILGERVREIRGVTDATNALFNAFGSAPAALKGTFVVQNGVVQTDDTRLDGREAVALTTGTVDLPAWRIDTRTELFRAQDTQTPYLVAEVQGPLDDPNARIGGQVFQRQPEAPPQDGGEQTAPGAQETPQQPQETDPEELIKEGLKGLLKGFGN